jgi:hypothetical protein
MFDLAGSSTRRLFAASLLVYTLALPVAQAQSDETGTEQSPQLEDLQDAPPPPDIIRSGEALEPEVTIIRKDSETLEEYRVAGKLYMVKVTPSVGPSYYMMDQDGDGKLELRKDRLDDYVIPQWVIFSW